MEEMQASAIRAPLRAHEDERLGTGGNSVRDPRAGKNERAALETAASPC
jgi:hypothetical protein